MRHELANQRHQLQELRTGQTAPGLDLTLYGSLHRLWTLELDREIHDAPVRLVYLLLSPGGDPEGHLATLAEIAALVANDESRGRLFSAATPEELLTRLRE